MKVILFSSENSGLCVCIPKCPGCGSSHYIPFEKGDKIWGFNNNLSQPTITPSVVEWYDANENIPAYKCHFNLTNGIMQFHGDCLHENKNKFIQLSEINIEYYKTIKGFYFTL